MARKFDIAVLGAGIVGVSSAIHLRRQGLSVVLIDRRGPGEETSFGNTGLIHREGVHPYLFPRSLPKLFQYGLNQRVDAYYQISSLLKVAPFLWRYFLNSAPAKAKQTLAANIALFEHALTTHGALIEASGSGNLIARNGWLAAFRTKASAAAAEIQRQELLDLGLDCALLSAHELSLLEPHLNVSELEGVMHYRDTWTASDPGALAKAYAALFEREGGVFVEADASAVQRLGGQWQFGEISANAMVVALGPWSKPFLDRLGVSLPMGVKRGYHRHYLPGGGAVLGRPIIDEDYGYVLAPMAQGIRLTSGAEFAAHDAPPSPVQLKRAEPIARTLFALGTPVEAVPWMGARPVFPDMRPVIGKLDRLDDVWVNFGHGHHGFTLGPATGLLLAQMITGRTTFMDPLAFSPARF